MTHSCASACLCFVRVLGDLADYGVFTISPMISQGYSIYLGHDWACALRPLFIGQLCLLVIARIARTCRFAMRLGEDLLKDGVLVTKFPFQIFGSFM